MSASTNSSSTLSEDDRRKSIQFDRTWAAEKLQLRLLMLDEKYRSEVMYQQVDAFEDKVLLSSSNYKVETMKNMIETLSKRFQPWLKIDSVASLRRALEKDEKKRDPSDTCIKYFHWFFQYLDYLRELNSNFVERIFHPLFKYFYEGGFFGDHRRGSTSSLSKFSSHFSLDTPSSSQTWDSNNSEELDDDAVCLARQKMQSKTALMLLSKEFADIKTLYDTSEVDKLATRLSFVKEQLDYLLDLEDSIDPDFLSQDSERFVQDLDNDEPLGHLLRLVPDILCKFQKAAWLARRWLQLDDTRTKDLNLKLQKILSLEEHITRRLSLLETRIRTHETELDTGLGELQHLLKREERSSDLNMNLLDLDGRLSHLHKQLELLRKDRDRLTDQVVVAIKEKNKKKYDSLKVLFQANRLQRYMVERQLATFEYQRDVAEGDYKVEVGLKPTLIHHTNSLQDECEQLESILSKERNEKHTLKMALIPIVEDRKQLSERLKEKRQSEPVNNLKVAQYLGSSRPKGQAQFIRTYSEKPTVATHLRSYSETNDNDRQS
ncbi:uncharacterized protein LOC121382370 [Gigantopelta aegis]|uniref:uncharacterized protein LOC121382370 n=1 Tax=Gigantopelta aegis TaxID=1735272 RepID=UPI001B88D3CA|nr:uncharacterized protein LOC121382370 [Gigantopelta aegis]